MRPSMAGVASQPEQIATLSSGLRKSQTSSSFQLANSGMPCDYMIRLSSPCKASSNRLRVSAFQNPPSASTLAMLDMVNFFI